MSNTTQLRANLSNNRYDIIAKFRFHLFHLSRFCGLALYWLVIAVSLLFALVALALKYAVLPNIERYQGDIISRVATASGMDVSAGAIRGGWDGFMPFVELENVVFLESEANVSSAPSAARLAGNPALKLPSLRAGLSWWSLFVGQVRFAEFYIEGPALALSRRTDGLIYFAGRALNAPQTTPDDGQLLTFLLDQPGIEIRNASLTWHDELIPDQDLSFANVGVAIKKRGSAHVLGFAANPPTALAQKIEAAGRLTLNHDSGSWAVSGPIYIAATNANLKELRQHVKVSDALQTGFGNLRAWVDIDTKSANPIRAITADMHVTNASAQLEPGLAALNLAKLAGRVEYVAQVDGFAIASKALELRTKEGVVLPAADFSLKLQNQSDIAKARGEVTGNGIELKVMAALIEFFPVGKEVRAVVARYSPRGLVRQSSFSWDGYIDSPAAYKVKGNVTDFAINNFERLPGVSGFSGEIEGDSKGGQFRIASKNFTLDAPQEFAQPLKFEQFAGEGSWKITPDMLEVKVDKVAVNNADMGLEFKGKYSRFRSGGARAAEEKGPGTLDISGRIVKANALAFASYVPNGLAHTREYIGWAVQGGEITSADFLVKGEIYEFPFHQGKGGVFKADANLKKVDFRYAEGWPIVNDIAGMLSFENTRISAKIDNARIYNAQLKKTVLSIEDTKQHPSMLTLTSAIDARGEDVSRFLRESPLISNVGAFTKFAAIEGPGKLDLALKIPLGTAEEKAAAKLNVSGSYQLTRGSAKLSFGPVINNLSGVIAFTESSVKSSNLQGTAFDNPLAIAITSNPDSGVTTEFTARADVAQLNDVLPFKMPQQVSGTADFHGRVLSSSPSKNGTEIIIDSPLTGVISLLPYPIAKRLDEARALRVVITDVGQPAERLHVTLAGNAPSSSASSAGLTDTLETRVDARFQRRFDSAGQAQGLFGAVAAVGPGTNTATIPEGIWLEGALPKFDFDAWRAAVSNFYMPIASSGNAPSATSPKNDSNSGSPAGFDMKFGSLIAYGRVFKPLSLKGRHASEDWRFQVEGQEASGDFTWRPGAFNDRGLVRARLKSFELADQALAANPPVTPVSPTSGIATPSGPTAAEADFPALDIVADNFKLKDHWMGKLELRATPQGPNWRIDQLIISNGHAKLEMEGLWQRAGDPDRKLAAAPASSATVPIAVSRTVMNLKVETSNLNALLSQFGHGDQIRGGTGKLDGKLSWPGHAFDFATANLSGDFKFESTNGSFTKVEAGAGKLLGLISLQSLPRRITLDFRDIFSNGFAFDRVGGDVRIDRGVMFTENFEIVGPAAAVKMTGDIALPTERANLTFTVAPKLDETVALSAGLFTLNPLVGVAVYVGQKVIGNPFEKLFSFKYAVSGTWDNPEVERIGASGTGRGASGAPAAPPSIPESLPAANGSSQPTLDQPAGLPAALLPTILLPATSRPNTSDVDINP